MASPSVTANQPATPGSEDRKIVFEAIERLDSIADVSAIPEEPWVTLLESACTFTPTIFNDIMLNLIKNPNITSSHLFRADILYDTGDDADCSFVGGVVSRHRDVLLDQLRFECRPRPMSVANMRLQRTIVRELVPRNPNLDRPLIQTCHLFCAEDNMQRSMVIYIPHVDRPEDMPFYHPAVRKLAFTHSWRDTDVDHMGHVSISYNLFPDDEASHLPTKLQRTALRLLQTVHKHGQGRLMGYQKRVQLDRIVPQKRYQDTYTRLKTTHGRRLVEAWVEVTDPGKHVFEDLAIAAFLIELWRDMYKLPPSATVVDGEAKADAATKHEDRPPFPGFVDIGCGNGLLVAILTAEGYPGWGFDARERKTWSTLGPDVRDRLEQRVLVPAMLQQAVADDDVPSLSRHRWHDGVFPRGTFIISNHADELTPWTPLLAAMNGSAFVAIPCCSHDLSGARFRAPPKSMRCREAQPPATKQTSAPVQRLPQQVPAARAVGVGGDDDAAARVSVVGAAETGSLARTPAQKKMPSAYATLCSYVVSLTEEMGFHAETEALRIPSTRNESIIGRTRRLFHSTNENDTNLATQGAIELVERELTQSITDVAKTWIERAEKLAEKPASGH